MNAQSTITLRSGGHIPVIGLGTWQLTGKDCLNSIKYALKLGYRMIDTSDDYKNQEVVGAAIAQSPIRREEIFVTTKVEENDDAYEKTRLDLKKLGLEWADLMLIHRPPEDSAGQTLWEGLIRARRDGLAKNIGVSNYSIEEIDRISMASGEVPAVNQIEWSPFGYSEEMLNYCRRNGIIIQAYSPLTRSKRLDERKLKALAKKYAKTPAQIVVRWNIQRGGVPIPKATSREHLQQNIDVFDFEIERSDMSLLDSFNESYSALGSKLQYAHK